MSETTLVTDAATTTTEGQTAAGATEVEAASTTADAESGAQQQQAAQAAQGDKAEGDKAAEGGAKDDDKAHGAPEKYEFTAPEGRSYDPAVLGKFEDIARKHNLTQEAAQEFLSEMGPTLESRQAEQISAVQGQWRTESQADKEFGGDRLTENLATAKKALDTFGSPELQTLLKTTGMGNHPEVIRFMYRAGKAISEDGFVAGGRGAADSDPAKRMFKDMN